MVYLIGIIIVAALIIVYAFERISVLKKESFIQTAKAAGMKNLLVISNAWNIEAKTIEEKYNALQKEFPPKKKLDMAVDNINDVINRMSQRNN